MDTERDSFFPPGVANPNWGSTKSPPGGEPHATIYALNPRLLKFFSKNFPRFPVHRSLIYNRSTMTAKQYPPGATHNRKGNGRGMKAVTAPVRKKRGAGAEPEARAATLAENRKKYRDLSAIPTAAVGDEVDPNKPLTEKAKLFVKYWAQGESIASASARAGYGDGATYAYRLVHYPQAKALYAQEKALYEQAGQMTRKKVMDMLIESYDMAKLAAEPSSMVSAAREIGKICGYYEPQKIKIEHSIKGEVARMDRMSDEELLDMIRNGGLPPTGDQPQPQPQLGGPDE